MPPDIFAASRSEVEVTVDARSFLPVTVQINQGEVVVFTNSDNIDHWPASNIHPSHAIYPEFDPKKPIQPGSVWKFRFDESGRFKYHDHLNPELGGTVVVNEVPGYSGTPIKTAKSKLDTISNQLRVQTARVYYRFFPRKFEEDLKKVNFHQVATDQKQLAYYVAIVGGEKFMQKLVADSGGGSVLDCHQEAHQAGRVAYALFGASVFRKGSADCHSGFYHGAMEAFLNQKGTLNLAKNITELCNNFKTSFSNFECLHGVGHGVLAYEDYNVPTALDTCRTLATPFAQSSCFGGVFMENIVTAQGRGARGGHNTTWVNEKAHFPCNAVDQEASVQTQCYLMQTSRMLDLYKYDFGQVANECLNAPKNMQDICFQSLGRDIAGYTLRDPPKIITLCKNVLPAFYPQCIKGALNVIIDFWGEQVTNQPSTLCGLTDSSYKFGCYNLLGWRLREIFGTDNSSINARCSMAEEVYRAVCKTAAGISHGKG